MNYILIPKDEYDKLTADVAALRRDAIKLGAAAVKATESWDMVKLSHQNTLNSYGAQITLMQKQVADQQKCANELDTAWGQRLEKAREEHAKQIAFKDKEIERLRERVNDQQHELDARRKILDSLKAHVERLFPDKKGLGWIDSIEFLATQVGKLKVDAECDTKRAWRAESRCDDLEEAMQTAYDAIKKYFGEES